MSSSFNFGSSKSGSVSETLCPDPTYWVAIDVEGTLEWDVVSPCYGVANPPPPTNPPTVIGQTAETCCECTCELPFSWAYLTVPPFADPEPKYDCTTRGGYGEVVELFSTENQVTGDGEFQQTSSTGSNWVVTCENIEGGMRVTAESFYGKFVGDCPEDGGLETGITLTREVGATDPDCELAGNTVSIRFTNTQE